MRPSPETLRTLFEGAPRFVERLAAEDAADWDELLARADQLAHAMPEDEQIELLNAHPRIGTLPAAVSALSYREQGYGHDADAAELQGRLQRLNDEYEARFGFRFVVFVNGRSRTAIADVLEELMQADRHEELQRGLSDLVAIARDRYGRLGSAPPALPAEVRDYYGRGKERERLNEGFGQIEFLRTQSALRRNLPGPPAVVLDVGGGTGVHASWLARDGYRVTLFEPVPLHLEQARAASAAQPEQPFSVELADARQLPVAGGSADVVLLLGPLYHLVERHQRIAALREAHRVLRPGGLLAAAAIGRFCDWLTGLQDELLDEPAYRRMAEISVRTGQHRSVEGQWFTTAYFHLPDELRAECEAGGFEVSELIALEGVAALLDDPGDRLAAPKRRRILLEALEFIEHEPSALSITAHLLAIAHKPGGNDEG